MQNKRKRIKQRILWKVRFKCNAEEKQRYKFTENKCLLINQAQDKLCTNNGLCVNSFEFFETTHQNSHKFFLLVIRWSEICNTTASSFSGKNSNEQRTALKRFNNFFHHHSPKGHYQDKNDDDDLDNSIATQAFSLLLSDFNRILTMLMMTALMVSRGI